MVVLIGTCTLANTYNENGYSYIKVPNGCVVINEETKEKVYIDYTPYGAMIVNQEGSVFEYYDETGINYEITNHNKSTKVGSGMITLIKKKR